MFKKIKSIQCIRNYRWWLWVAVLAASVLLAVFHYRTSYVRVFQSALNLGTSVACYFVEVFNIEAEVSSGITKLINVNMSPFLPFSLEELRAKLPNFLPAFFSLTYTKAYLYFILTRLETFLLFLSMLIPIIPMLVMLRNSIYLTETDKKGVSKPLGFFLCIVLPVIRKIRAWLAEQINVCYESGIYKVILFVWILNLNITAIVISALAFYFYFVATFSIPALLVSSVNLIADLAIMFWGLPFILWLILGYKLLSVFREWRGYKKLEHNEAKNRGYINSLPLVNLLTGYMEAGKNTTETDMLLSWECMMRDMALEAILKQSHKFPDFPWRELEKEIERAYNHHQIYTLESARIFATKKYLRFCKDSRPEKLYGYDFERLPFRYDNGMYYEDLPDVIFDYVQQYMIYYHPSSLILSSYSIRSGAKRADCGHFPLWQNDFFRAPSISGIDPKQNAHILDYDIFRMGKKVNDENPHIGSFEFGGVGMSEKGKERGNAIENQSHKKTDENANPKNDLFNADLKLRRHGATVDFKTYLKFFGDEQRPESVGADEREVSMILRIMGSSEDLLALPFFELETVIDHFMVSGFDRFYLKYKYYREDMTLLVYLWHHLVAGIHGFFTRKFNTFGYKEITIGREKGTLDGELELHPYYISRKKTYSLRFSTDCYKDVFAVQTRKCKKGLNDIQTYEGICATIDELKQQNSYFINDLTKHTGL